MRTFLICLLLCTSLFSQERINYRSNAQVTAGTIPTVHERLIKNVDTGDYYFEEPDGGGGSQYVQITGVGGAGVVPGTVIRLETDGTRTVYTPAGATDVANYVALTAAVAASGPGDIIIGDDSSKYEFNGTILSVLDDNVTVVDVNIRRGTLDYATIWNCSGADNLKMENVLFDGESGLEFDIVGGGKTYPPSTAWITTTNPNDTVDTVVIRMTDCDNARLHNVSIRDHSGTVALNGFGLPQMPECYGIELDANCSECKIENSTFELIGFEAILNRGLRTHVFECNFEMTGWHAISDNGSDSLIQGCNFFEREQRLGGWHTAIDLNPLSHASKATISYCTFNHAPWLPNLVAWSATNYNTGDTVYRVDGGTTRIYRVTAGSGTSTVGPSGTGTTIDGPLTWEYSMNYQGHFQVKFGDTAAGRMIKCEMVGATQCGDPTTNRRNVKVENLVDSFYMEGCVLDGTLTGNTADNAKPVTIVDSTINPTGAAKIGIAMPMSALALEDSIVGYQTIAVQNYPTGTGKYTEGIRFDDNVFIATGAGPSHVIPATTIADITDRIEYDDSNLIEVSGTRYILGTGTHTVSDTTNGTRFVKFGNGPIEVKTFGASPSATASVNAAAFQAAIDMIDVQHGGVVEFGQGTFLIDSTIVIPGRGITLRGLGVFASTIQSSVSGDAIRINDGLQTTYEVQYNALADFMLDGNSTGTIGLRIGDANSANLKSANNGSYRNLVVRGFTDAGVLCDASQINSFVNCKFSNNPGDGLRMADSSETAAATAMNTANKFVNVSFRRNGRGVVLNDGSYANSFSECTFEQNDGLGVTIEKETFGNFTNNFDACYFESNCNKFDATGTSLGDITGTLPAGVTGDYIDVVGTEVIGGRTFTDGVRYFLSGNSAGGTATSTANQWIASTEKSHVMTGGTGAGPTTLAFENCHMSNNLDFEFLVRRGRMKIDNTLQAGAGSAQLVKTDATSTAVVHILGEHLTINGTYGNDSIVTVDDMKLNGTQNTYVKQPSGSGLQLMQNVGRYWYRTSGATHDVTQISRIELDYSSFETITNFTGGERGQRLTVLSRDGNVAIENGGNFELKQDWRPTLKGGVLVLERHNGSGGSEIWREVDRTDYTSTSVVLTELVCGAADTSPNIQGYSNIKTSGGAVAITDFDYGGAVVEQGHMLYVTVQPSDSLVDGTGTIKLALGVDFAPISGGTIILKYETSTGWVQQGEALSF